MSDTTTVSKKGINFKHFYIENGRSFEKVSIPLCNQGIVLVQGDNGVGKSSIWDIFEAVLYGSTPEDHKKDELTKNDKDAIYTISFEKNDELYNVSLKRKKGKWSYDIQKENTPITEHSYTDAVKSVSKLLGLTKSEFEGSIHLTQSSQHILIKSELSERKKYISNFFGIDDRYDQIHLAAKQEYEKVTEQISKLAGLSHSKQMLENELVNLDEKNISEIQNKLNVFTQHLDMLTTKLELTTKDLTTWQSYKQHHESANLVPDPDTTIKEIEKDILDNKAKLNYIEDTRKRNEQAYKVNGAIDDLESTKEKIQKKYPDISEDKILTAEYEKELRSLQNIKTQNDSVQSLRKELESLPVADEISIKVIEEQLLQLQVDYQTHAKNKVAKEKGICVECGSKFTTQDVQQEIALLSELRESIDVLNEDFTFIKNKNSQIKRKKLLADHLSKIPEFSKENQKRLKLLEKYIPHKKEYQEVDSSLKILSRMEIAEEINHDDAKTITDNIQKNHDLLDELKKCQISKQLLPEKPNDDEEVLLKLKSSLHTEVLNIKLSIQDTTQTLGEYKNNNETFKRLTGQLEELNKKLNKLDELKKTEFFWSKLVDAYGPKGLRIQQLEKMMDIIIKQLPVYCSILFREKRLQFKHKVDPNNVKILACREEEDDKGKIKNKFEHDISCFSGGEKDLMSTSFILTLADCVPYHKKANILILDEVDAQLDTDGKYRFTNQLLPMLRKKHDTIFVISHNKEVQLANIYDQVWEIQKINHISTIKMTLVNQYN